MDHTALDRWFYQWWNEPWLSLPDDGARWVALLAAPLVVLALPMIYARVRRDRWIALMALGAALLSWGYIASYLRGGPRIVDATSYFLQGRAMAAGHFAWPLSEPEASLLGRFLLRVPTDAGAQLSGIFPPGYPALLAIGFRLGAPLAIGPVLAALLVIVSAALARELGRALWPTDPRSVDQAMRLAATCSMLCAALRYHTADTMSHGFAALCLCLALLAALRSHRSESLGARRRWAAGAGLASGCLWVTRPASALALGVVLLLIASYRPRRVAWLSWLAGALPGVVLWLAFQHATTGSAWHTAQQSYYALSDGPPGCFRYGFGPGIGCVGEHGDFVRHNLTRGYDALAAAGTSLRRLKMHLGDPLNSAPLFALPLAGMLMARRERSAAVIAAVPLALLLAYMPFYFDGNYPGGGARMLADGLPIEHALTSCAAIALARARRVPPARAAALLAACMLLGFALESGRDHAALRDREGGAPMFEPERVGPGHDGLLFVDTDHGFNLAFDPAAPTRVARFKSDDLDRIAWDERGRPQAWRYHFRWDGQRPARVAIEALRFDPRPSEQLPLRIEAESLWPPLAQQGGHVWPSYESHDCVSAGRVLALYPALYPQGPEAMVRLRLPAAALAGRPMSVRAFQGSEKTSAIFSVYADERRIALVRIAPKEGNPCVELAPIELPPEQRSLVLELRSRGPTAIDALQFGEKR